MIVQIGCSAHDVGEELVKEQVRRNYQGKGLFHAIKFYRHLRPDDGYQESKETVLSWCEGLTEGRMQDA